MNKGLQRLCLLVLFAFSISTIYAQTTRIKTRYSNDWDDWEASSVRIKTKYSNDWDNWEYSINGKSGSIKTRYSEDWDSWEVGNVKLKTRYSNDWDDWEISGDLSKLNASTKAAVMFIPIFVASIHQKGINK